MDEKSLITLEYPKILEKLAEYASFSASAELARAMKPCADLAAVLDRLACTTEARYLINVSSISIGAARDIRPLADLAAHAGVLQPLELLAVRDTLISARELKRKLIAGGNPSEIAQGVQLKGVPHLAVIAADLTPPPGIIDAISRAINENGEILDSASKLLGTIRRDMKIAHDRLMERMQRMVLDPKTAPMLQEGLITIRNGRYVLPLRAEFKGKIPAMIHDQSSSGATLFIEPLVMVDLNNQWHELQLAERDEIRRILTELSAMVGTYQQEINAVVGAMAEIDLAFMCAKYAEAIDAVEPVLVPPRAPNQNHPGSCIRLYKARHPLLNPLTTVPIDIVLEEDTFGLVITGPNTGGKTVTLKTMGLLVLMAQSGLHIPAQSGSTLSIFQDVFADIGDEQSIEQNLSTFSGHIQNIIRILNLANSSTLVLLDELGSGTDPQEGAALARAILDYLVKNKIPCLVATHFPELKTYAHATDGVTNASMAFDIETLRPTYHLNIGLPGRSNALLIAERLGLPKEIIEAARATVSPDELRADHLLDDIHHQRDLAAKARKEADEARREAEKLRASLVTRLDKIEDERAAMLAEARAAMESELGEFRKEIEALRRELRRTHQPLEPVKTIEEQVERIDEAIQESQTAVKPLTKTHRLPRISAKNPLQAGERVLVRSLKMNGTVIGVTGDEVEVQLGALRMRTNLDDIRRAGETEEEPALEEGAKARTVKTVTERVAERKAAESAPLPVFRASPGMELDLRGHRADDALDKLERYLESAFLAGMPFVRIIHGKGTGRLREVVRQALQNSSHVQRWEAGGESEGGSGVTVAHLNTH